MKKTMLLLLLIIGTALFSLTTFGISVKPVNYEGVVVYPDRAVEDIEGVMILKEGNPFSYFINTLIGKQALYPSKNTYVQGENVVLQSEFQTWNVICNNVRVVFEIYKPSSGLLAALSQSWEAQTGSQYINAYTNLHESRFTELGTYEAVVYAICSDDLVVFRNNNPEYVLTNHPLISTPSVSETSFEIVAPGPTPCVPTNDRDHTQCYNDNIYWYNECGSLTSIKEGCSYGCLDDSICRTEPIPTPTPTPTPIPVPIPSGRVGLEITSIKRISPPVAQEVLPGDNIQVDVTVKNMGDTSLQLDPSASNYYLEVAVYPDEFLIENDIMTYGEADPFFAAIFGFAPQTSSCGGEAWVTSHKIYDLPAREERTISINVVAPSPSDIFADGSSAWDYNPKEVTIAGKTKNVFSHQIAGFIYEGCADGNRDVRELAGKICGGGLMGGMCDWVTHDAFKGPDSNVVILRTCTQINGVSECPGSTPHCVESYKTSDVEECCVDCVSKEDNRIPGLTLDEIKDGLTIAELLTHSCTETGHCQEGSRCKSISSLERDKYIEETDADSLLNRAPEAKLSDYLSPLNYPEIIYNKIKNAIVAKDPAKLGICVITEEVNLWDQYVGLFEWAGEYQTVAAVGIPIMILLFFFMMAAGGRRR